MNKNLLIFVGVAVILLVFVYYFSLVTENQVSEDLPTPTGDTSVGALEQELTAMDLDNLDQEFADIEMELEAAISEAQ